MVPPLRKFPIAVLYKPETVAWNIVKSVVVPLIFAFCPGRTPKMLDYLKALNVPATFFVVGLMAQWRSATLIREFNEGHVISSHSFSHPDLTKMSDQAMMAEVSNNEELLASLTCYRPKIFRPPFGALLDPQIKILHVRRCWGPRVTAEWHNGSGPVLRCACVLAGNGLHHC